MELRPMPTCLTAMTIAALGLAIAGPSFAADVSAGKALYEAKCGGCHSVDANRIGPLHRGVVGRKVASVPAYDYSPALKNVTGTWNAERLDTWLQNPQAVAPGTKMYFSVDDPADRAAIIGYLVSVSEPVKR